MHTLFTTGTNPSIERTLLRSGKFRRGKIDCQQFADGEWYIRVREPVRGIEPVVLASTFPPADNIVKLLILLHTLRENSARPATLLIPYFGYARQDRRTRAGEGTAAHLLIDLIGNPWLVGRVVLIDIHNSKILRQFRVPVKNLDPSFLLVHKTLSLIRANGGIRNWVVVAPDKGAIRRARSFANLIGGVGVAWCEKYRPRPNIATIRTYHGPSVRSKSVLIVDDMIDTGGTLVKTIQFLKKSGVRELYVAATHGVFSGNALERLRKAGVKSLLVTDTIPHKRLPPWVTTTTAAPLFQQD